MKKLLVTIAILTAFFLAYQKVPAVRHILSYSPCDTLITYKLGSIDPRFGLTTTQVLSDTNSAAAIWNSSIQKNIFSYDPDGEITINFIYDERQELNSKINNLQDQLDSDKGSLDPQIEDYKKREASFDQKAAALNQDISYWNSRGGAPQDEYDKLIARQNALKQEADALNATARSLNQATRDYNSQIGVLNKTEKELSQTLTLKPEEGLYNANDNSITIYFNNSKAELIHTLAHELGHARGLRHNNSSDSIMYPSSTEDTTPSTLDLDSLEKICQERSYLHLVILGYTNLIQDLKRKAANNQ